MIESDAPGHVRVAILGSCVSRDTFEILDPNRFSLETYIARHSIVSARSDAGANMPNTWEVASRFQRRNIESDVKGDLETRLAAVAQQTDLLLWDLIDERHGYVQFNDGTIVNRSIDVLSNQELRTALAAGRHYEFGTDEHFAEWSAAAAAFLAVLGRLNLMNRTLIIAEPWASEDRFGKRVPPSLSISPEDANKKYGRYYAFLEKAGLPLASTPTAYADESHRWGFAPFHYDSTVYESLRDEIELFSDRLSHSTIVESDRAANSDPLPSTVPWFVLDRNRTTLIAMPALRGYSTSVRLAMYSYELSEYVAFQPMGLNGLIVQNLSDLKRLHDYSVKLQRRTQRGWENITRLERISASVDVEVHRIRPTDWGVTDACLAVVRDLKDKSTQLRVTIQSNDSVTCILEFPYGRKLQLDLYALPEVDGKNGPRLSEPIRLVPHWQRGSIPSDIRMVGNKLFVSRRTDVTLIPVNHTRIGNGATAIHGYFGAWERGEPIIEAMEFSRGRQQYYYTRCPENVVSEIQERAIYLGIPPVDDKRFLLDGIDRTWSALQNPDLPIIWNTRELSRRQADILSVMGIQNHQYFISGPVRCREVLFPSSGLMSDGSPIPEFLHLIEKVSPEQPISGRKLFVKESADLVRQTPFVQKVSRDIETTFQNCGFEIYEIDDRRTAEVLEEVSASETVFALQQRPLSLLLLLRKPVRTKFWSIGILDNNDELARMMQHSGIDFDCIQLRAPFGDEYSTLDGAPLAELDRLLRETNGLTENVQQIPIFESSSTQQEYRFLQDCLSSQVVMTGLERDLTRAMTAFHNDNQPMAERILSGYL